MDLRSGFARKILISLAFHLVAAPAEAGTSIANLGGGREPPACQESVDVDP